MTAPIQRGNLDILGIREFRVFFIGFTTSLLGSSMATVALAFAVLGSHGSPADLGYVMAARALPLVLFLLGGGILGDRLPRRWVMLAADGIRAPAQAGVAVLFLAGRPTLWALLPLVAVGGVGEALFAPSLNGLVPTLMPPDRLPDANALLGLARSTATVAGPAVAGALVALVGPAMVLAIDATSYAVSVLALALLRLPDNPRPPASTTSHFRAGWDLFRSHRWLWTVTLQFTLFNFLVWAPFLVLGPAAARAYYGGPGAWGFIMAAFGVGATVAGLLMLGRRPRRPLVVTTVVTFGWAAPSGCIALGAPLVAVAVAGLVAGAAQTVFETLWATTVQQNIPNQALSRIMSFATLGAFSLAPLGLALAGPVAAATSIRAVLAVGLAWQLVMNTVLLTLPAIRGLISRPLPRHRRPRHTARHRRIGNRLQTRRRLMGPSQSEEDTVRA